MDVYNLIMAGFVTGKDINAALVSISEKQKSKQRRNRDPTFIEKVRLEVSFFVVCVFYRSNPPARQTGS